MDKKILKIYQLQDGYCYNSDSLFLYDFARSFLKKDLAILDVGCGSGIIGLLCAKESQSRLTMIEQDVAAAFLARLNARNFLPTPEVVCGDFLDYSFGEKFDIVVSNPPFYRSGAMEAKNLRIKNARSEQSLPFDRLCVQVKRWLKPMGKFLFCYDAKEAHRVFYTLKNTGLNPEVARFVHPRIDKEASLLLCQARINAKSSLKILPPLITHNSKMQTDNTDEVKAIYARANTYSIKVRSNDLSLEESKQ